ncbi:hypothetical protein QOZ80_6BG0476870 [Eleusine coracana subsp. coracana]|nr:hypothetical protein QOZ80_6BG0476870 [Eleusine coracana subsp. coracana]
MGSNYQKYGDRVSSRRSEEQRRDRGNNEQWRLNQNQGGRDFQHRSYQGDRFHRDEANHRQENFDHPDFDRGGSVNERGGHRSEEDAYRHGGKRRAEDEGEARTNPKEQDLCAKLMKNKEVSGSQEGWKQTDAGNKMLICYNCNNEGHHQGQCTNLPMCFNCKTEGHKAMFCPIKRGLRNCGFGIPGMGFHSIHITEKNELNQEEVLGIMSIIHGIGSIEIVDKELCYLFENKNEWKIRALSDSEFIITFPDIGMRDQLTKFKNFGFETAQVVASVKATDISPDSSAVLESIWVTAYNWHPKARTKDIVREIASLIGDPEEVDTISLIRNGPVRVKVEVRDASQIRGETEIFFNRVGRKIKWVVDTSSNRNPPPPSDHNQPSKFDRHRDKDGDGDDFEEDHEYRQPENCQATAQQTNTMAT